MDSRNRRQAALPILLMIVIFGVSLKETAGNILSSHSHAPGRHLLQVDNASDTAKYLGDNTARVDPLDNFKKYRGGYNLTNKHYWSSTVFTGVYGYTIAILWLLIAVAFGFYMLLVRSCGGRTEKCRDLKKRAWCHKQCPLWPVLIAFIFMVLAIVAVGLVLGANAKFHSRAKTVVSIIIGTADDASEQIYKTTGAMRDIKDTLELSKGSAYASSYLMTTSEKLDSAAADIQRQARKNRRLIDKGLEIVYLVTTVTICLNLVVAIALSVSGFLRLRRLLYWLIALCWLLTVLCWIFFGLYFFLDKFSSDTCTALDEFQQDPNNNSLSSILPCDELLSAKSILSGVSAGIYDMVNKVNENISHLQATSPNLMYVCNPFSPPPEYDYQPDKCPGNTIKIGDIPKVLKIFTCSDPNGGNCSGGPYLSASNYKTVEAYTSSIQSLLNAYPGMESLIECQSVKEAFSQILTKHCGPLKRYAQMVWASLVLLSVIMVSLVLIWTAKAIQDEKHQHADGSVKPHSTALDLQEPGKSKEFQDNVDYGPV